jgi:hypothetical protein
MTKSDEAKAREQRLAAKLRENLRRRKGQLRARSESGTNEPAATDSHKGKDGKGA